MLKVGNFLNSKTPNGNAKAYDIRVLAQLKGCKSRNGTFLDYVTTMLMRHVRSRFVPSTCSSA